jgi:SAM-dependent methyltransferase
LRLSIVLAVVGAVVGLAIRAAGGWTKAQERIQPVLFDGSVGRLVARTYAPLNRWIYAALARTLTIRSDDDVLDVGCGSGVFLRDWAGHARRIAGLDQSEAMIGEARRQHRARILAETAEFVVGDAASLPWDSDQFTIVTSNCVGCFEAKALPAIQEMYRVLKPGGRAVLTEDHRSEMEAAGFTGITTEPFLERVATIGYKA